MDFLDYVKQAIETNSEVKYDSLNSRFFIGGEALFSLKSSKSSALKQVVDINESVETAYILINLNQTDAAYRIMRYQQGGFIATEYKVEVAGDHVRFFFEEIAGEDKLFEPSKPLNLLHYWLVLGLCGGIITFLIGISGLL